MVAAAALSCGRGEAGRPTGPASRPNDAAQIPPATAPLVPEREGASPRSDLPVDVPSYPGASVVASSSAPKQGILISFQSKDTPEKVFEFYRQKLPAQGWNVEGEMSSADQRMLIAGKGDRKASVLVSAGDAGLTEITLTLTHGEG